MSEPQYEVDSVDSEITSRFKDAFSHVTTTEKFDTLDHGDGLSFNNQVVMVSESVESVGDIDLSTFEPADYCRTETVEWESDDGGSTLVNSNGCTLSCRTYVFADSEGVETHINVEYLRKLADVFDVNYETIRSWVKVAPHDSYEYTDGNYPIVVESNDGVRVVVTPSRYNSK